MHVRFRFGLAAVAAAGALAVSAMPAAAQLNVGPNQVIECRPIPPNTAPAFVLDRGTCPIGFVAVVADRPAAIDAPAPLAENSASGG